MLDFANLLIVEVLYLSYLSFIELPQGFLFFTERVFLLWESEFKVAIFIFELMNLLVYKWTNLRLMLLLGILILNAFYVFVAWEFILNHVQLLFMHLTQVVDYKLLSIVIFDKDQ